MYSITLPFTDWTLLVSPRWGDLDPPAQVAALALLGLVPLALVLWLYRYELRLVRRSAAAFLLGVRVLVLLPLWCVVAWQPVLARSTTEEIPARVVVAVDRSGSMSVTDPQRTAEEKQALARALKIDGPPETVDALTRAEVARRILADDGAGLLN